MANDTEIDQVRSEQMQRLLAEQGEAAVAQRYGEDALSSQEYQQAQQRIRQVQQRENQMRREAFAEQRQSSNGDQELVDDQTLADREQDPIEQGSDVDLAAGLEADQLQRDQLAQQEADEAAQDQHELQKAAEVQQEMDREMGGRVETLDQTTDEAQVDDRSEAGLQTGSQRDEQSQSEASTSDESAEQADGAQAGPGRDPEAAQDGQTGAAAERQARIRAARENLRQDGQAREAREQSQDQDDAMSR